MKNDTTPQSAHSPDVSQAPNGIAECSEAGDHSRFQRFSGWLWVSAGILAGLIVLQSGGLYETPLLGSQAHAEMVTSSGSFSMMTTDGGNDEVLVIVDSRQESLMIYRNFNNNELRLLDREELDGLFSRARARATGRP